MDTPTSPRSRRRRIALIIAAALAGLVFLGILLVKLSPGVYRRTEAMGLDDAAAGRFNELVLNQIGNVFLDRSGGTRLNLEVTEEMANAKLALAVAEQEQTGKAPQPALRDLRIGFEPGRIVLATRLGSGLSAVVVSQSLRLEAGLDGSLCVVPERMGAGVLPLPAGVMEGALRALAERLARHPASEAASADDKSFDLSRAVIEALGGKPVFMGKGKNRILLDRIEIDRGVLRNEGHRAGAVKRTAAPSGDIETHQP